MDGAKGYANPSVSYSGALPVSLSSARLEPLPEIIRPIQRMLGYWDAAACHLILRGRASGNPWRSIVLDKCLVP